MRTTSITLCLVLASFGVSAKILADPDLTYQANKTCAKRDVLELKVPLEANNPSSPHGVWTRAWCRATIDALKENPDIAPADSVACQQAAIKQYRAGQNTTVSSSSCRDAHQLKPVCGIKNPVALVQTDQRIPVLNPVLCCRPLSHSDLNYRARETCQ